MKKRYDEIMAELEAMYDEVQNEDRELTDKEMKTATRLMDELDVIERSAEKLGPKNPETFNKILSSMVPGGGRFERSTGKPYTLRGPGDRKDYRSLFGNAEPVPWQYDDLNFWQALFSGRAHPGLVRAMQEGIGGDGGFLVPTEFARQIHDVALENEIVAPRAFIQPMKSNQIEIPAFEIGSHASHLLGGFIAYYKGEAASLTEADPKVRRMELNAAKLTGLVRMSNELVADADTDRIVEVCGKGLGFYRDNAFLNGTGAGRPLGILNANCTVVTSKEGGQAASTIVYENLTNMLMHLHPACFKNAVWVCHQTTIPQLLGLTITAGTGGSHYPVLSESNGQYRMLTLPVVFTEKTEALGTQGDILLADFMQYVIGLREGMRIDHSIHVHFQTDELLTRLIERHDGQPLWDDNLTLKDGSTEVSPFVVLEDR